MRRAYNGTMKHVTTAGAARELHVTTAHIRRLCAIGQIKGAKKAWGSGDWMIPAPVVWQDRGKGGWPTGSGDSVRVAKELGISIAWLRRLCAAGRIEGAYKNENRHWVIPADFRYVGRLPRGRPLKNT